MSKERELELTKKILGKRFNIKDNNLIIKEYTFPLDSVERKSGYFTLEDSKGNMFTYQANEVWYIDTPIDMFIDKLLEQEGKL